MKMLNLVKLLGVSSCCLVLAVSVAKADAVVLSDTDLDRLTAGELSAPAPLFELPPQFAGQFDIPPGLFDPLPPAEETPPDAEPTPSPVPEFGGVPGQVLQTILKLVLSGELR